MNECQHVSTCPHACLHITKFINLKFKKNKLFPRICTYHTFFFFFKEKEFNKKLFFSEYSKKKNCGSSVSQTKGERKKQVGKESMEVVRSVCFDSRALLLYLLKKQNAQEKQIGVKNTLKSIAAFA